MSRTVVHVVPQLPPPQEGVGSFAMSLAAALLERYGTESRFVVGSPSWTPNPEGGGISALGIPQREPGSLYDTLDTASGAAAAAILLHYANYGYEPRGCPAWLIGGLAAWKARARCRLVTVFHEVHATGPPWRSSFWLIAAAAAAGCDPWRA